jgi:hypothetical protein
MIGRSSPRPCPITARYWKKVRYRRGLFLRQALFSKPFCRVVHDAEIRGHQGAGGGEKVEFRLRLAFDVAEHVEEGGGRRVRRIDGGDSLAPCDEGQGNCLAEAHVRADPTEQSRPAGRRPSSLRPRCGVPKYGRAMGGTPYRSPPGQMKLCSVFVPSQWARTRVLVSASRMNRSGFTFLMFQEVGRRKLALDACECQLSEIRLAPGPERVGRR